MKRARIEIPREVQLVPIDFNRESLAEVLEKAGYEAGEKSLFIWEGVSYYLEAAAVDAILAFFHRASHGESTIAFDYTTPISESNWDALHGAKEFAQTMKEHHADEALMFAIADHDLASFLVKRGLRIVEHLDSEEIERRFLTDENGSLIGRMTGHFRFVSASKKEA